MHRGLENSLYFLGLIAFFFFSSWNHIQVGELILSGKNPSASHLHLRRGPLAELGGTILPKETPSNVLVCNASLLLEPTVNNEWGAKLPFWFTLDIINGNRYTVLLYATEVASGLWLWAAGTFRISRQWHSPLWETSSLSLGFSVRAGSSQR